MRRREFLTISAGAIGATALYILTRESGPLELRDANVVVPLRFFTAKEARVVSAACESIFPRDASGPGAMDAGVVIYIDRQLAGPYGRDKYRYVKPPFVTSVPEHGYQGKEARARSTAQVSATSATSASFPLASNSQTESNRDFRFLPAAASSHDRRHVLRPGAWG